MLPHLAGDPAAASGSITPGRRHVRIVSIWSDEPVQAAPVVPRVMPDAPWERHGARLYAMAYGVLAHEQVATEASAPGHGGPPRDPHDAGCCGMPEGRAVFRAVFERSVPFQPGGRAGRGTT